MALLTSLSDDEQSTFLVVSLPPKALRKLVGALGTAPPGSRLDALGTWDLAWSLVDFYARDAEVADAVDRALRRELGPSPLAAAVSAEGGGAAVAELVLQAKDPARDLAWAILSTGGDGAGPLVQTIIAEFDDADERAKREAEAQSEQPAAEPEPDAAAIAAREAEREATRARGERDRAKKRVDELKGRAAELEQGLAAARRELRAAQDARERAETERARLAEERTALRARLDSGVPAEVARLETELEAAQRRLRGVEGELEESREAEATLTSRVRALESERAPRAQDAAAAVDERAAGSGPGWSLPVFTDEFYDSIRRWDRKIIRITFEKIVRLAEDWRHPSLRAIPLEGLPDSFRIRIASDVRLIYRPLDGGRVEILSLIDREDLQRYIRQAKTKRGA